MDYRVNLRRFEFERLMLPRQQRRPMVGYPFLTRLLSHCTEIPKSEFYDQFSSLPELHRTLYAISTFDGEVGNGGISQFFFNRPPFIWFEVEEAFNRIGAQEMCGKYLRELQKRIENSKLNELRQAASSSRTHREIHSNYLEFCETYENSEVQDQFNSKYYRHDRIELDQKLRAYLQGRDEEAVRICDGNETLEREWFEHKLHQLILPVERWRTFKEQNPSLRVYDFAPFPTRFSSTAFQKLGFTKSARKRAAYRIIQSIWDRVQSHKIHVGLMSFAESPTPRITIDLGKSWLGSSSIFIDYSESEIGSPIWRMSRWR